MTNSIDFLGKSVKVVMDRPLGSIHPKHGFTYEANYGYIPDTKSPDGEELDAYVLGVTEPLQEFEGVCVAVIQRTNDNDDKLVVIPEGTDITDEEIDKATAFQEKFFQHKIVR